EGIERPSLIPSWNRQRFNVLALSLGEYEPIRPKHKACERSGFALFVLNGSIVRCLALARHWHAQHDRLFAFADMSTLFLPAYERRYWAWRDATFSTLDEREDLIADRVTVEGGVRLRDHAWFANGLLKEICKRCRGWCRHVSLPPESGEGPTVRYDGGSR